jgi:hypothetical protein
MPGRKSGRKSGPHKSGRKSRRKSPRQNLKGRKSFQKSRYSKDRKPPHRFCGVTYRAPPSTPPSTSQTTLPTPNTDTTIGYESPQPATKEDEEQFNMMMALLKKAKRPRVLVTAETRYK